MVKIEQFLVGNMDNFTYAIIDEKNRKSIIIDPSWDLEIIFDFLKKNKIENIYIINTHSHFDHVLGNDQVVKRTGAKIIQHKRSPLKKDIEVNDGEYLRFGEVDIKIIHTPGHSGDSICLVIGDKILLTGDTLFVGSCGRLDLQGSDPTEMYYSIYDKLFNLDGNLIVYPGHHYGNTKTSTLNKEKNTNFVFKFHNLQEFLNFMDR
jgi:glyoxylase-like metal-dependent hydrolase (beta-lactamase superfamily II)